MPVPEPQPVSQPKIVPTVPEAPVAPTVPRSADDSRSSAIPNVPEIPTVPAIPASAPQPTGIWPWPQTDEWDDSAIRKMLRDAMESAKAGNIEESKRALVSLGPHLGSRIDLIFHIGVLLKKYGQEDVMRRMIESIECSIQTLPMSQKRYNICFPKA